MACYVRSVDLFPNSIVVISRYRTIHILKHFYTQILTMNVLTFDKYNGTDKLIEELNLPEILFHGAFNIN